MKYKLTNNSTLSVSHKKVEKKWILIDASNLIVGRLSAFLVTILKGKNTAIYTPNIDGGYNVIVINCDKIAFTGEKDEKKLYHHHTGHPGGMKIRTAKEVRKSADPCDILRLSVKRMLGKGPMAYARLGNLHLYVGPEHKNESQRPEVIDFASFNSKNKI